MDASDALGELIVHASDDFVFSPVAIGGPLVTSLLEDPADLPALGLHQLLKSAAKVWRARGG